MTFYCTFFVFCRMTGLFLPFGKKSEKVAFAEKYLCNLNESLAIMKILCYTNDV